MKLPSRIISYSDFCNYENANFINSLNEALCENENAESFLKDPDYFCKICTEVLNRHAPCKKKHVCGNSKHDKAISTAIISAKKKVKK